MRDKIASKKDKFTTFYKQTVLKCKLNYLIITKYKYKVN